MESLVWQEMPNCRNICWLTVMVALFFFIAPIVAQIKILNESTATDVFEKDLSAYNAMDCNGTQSALLIQHIFLMSGKSTLLKTGEKKQREHKGITKIYSFYYKCCSYNLAPLYGQIAHKSYAICSNLSWYISVS